MERSINHHIRTCLHLGRPARLPVLLFTPPFDLRGFGLSHAEYACSVDSIAQTHIQAARIARLKKHFAGRVCICGHVTAPFSSVLYLFGTGVNNRSRGRVEPVPSE